MYWRYFQLISTWKQPYCIIAEKMSLWLTTLGFLQKTQVQLPASTLGGGEPHNFLQTKIFEKREVAESFSSLL